MFAASIEGLTAEERANFNDALAPRRGHRMTVTWSCRTCPHRGEVLVVVPPAIALPPAAGDRPALRSVPAPAERRITPERLAAIRALGGDVQMGQGA